MAHKKEEHHHKKEMSCKAAKPAKGMHEHKKEHHKKEHKKK